MKKNIMFLFVTACLCVGLTACGSFVNETEVYSMELTEEIKEELSEERMLSDLAEREIRIGSYYGPLTEDMIGSWTFDEYELSGNECYRTAEIILANTDTLTLCVTAGFTYEYDGSEWTVANLTSDVEITGQNIAGRYTGALVTSDGREYAFIEFYFDELNEDGSLSGLVGVMPYSADVIEFKEISCTFRDDILVIDTSEWLSYYGYQSYSLSYNVMTNQFENNDPNLYFTLTKKR